MSKLPDFKTTYVALVEAEKAAADGHPDLDDLIACHRGGELAAEDQSRVHAHLLECRECATAVAELESFRKAACGEPQSVDFETVASWHALRRRLGKRRWYFPTALAASFLAAVLGLSTWIVVQQRTLAEHRKPRPNAAIVDLIEDASRRAGGPPQEIGAPAAGVTLVLTPDVVPAFPSYEITILDSTGSVVRTVSGLENQPENDTFTVFLPPGSLAAGDYRIELHGRGDESGEPIASYRIRWTGAS